MNNLTKTDKKKIEAIKKKLCKKLHFDDQTIGKLFVDLAFDEIFEVLIK